MSQLCNFKMTVNANIIRINALKYDGAVHRTWKAELIKQTDSLLTLVGQFENEVSHQSLGVIRRNTLSYEFYWLDSYFNIFRFHEPEGELRNFYCNVNMPPKFENGVLSYIDLDIDILVWKDFSYEILDLEEFEENARTYGYPGNLREKVRASIKELETMIEKRIFPFDYEF